MLRLFTHCKKTRLQKRTWKAVVHSLQLQPYREGAIAGGAANSRNKLSNSVWNRDGT